MFLVEDKIFAWIQARNDADNALSDVEMNEASVLIRILVAELGITTCNQIVSHAVGSIRLTT